MDNMDMDLYFAKLPAEVILNIFKKLSNWDLAQYSLVDEYKYYAIDTFESRVKRHGIMYSGDYIKFAEIVQRFGNAIYDHCRTLEYVPPSEYNVQLDYFCQQVLLAPEFRTVTDLCIYFPRNYQIAEMSVIGLFNAISHHDGMNRLYVETAVTYPVYQAWRGALQDNSAVSMSAHRHIQIDFHIIFNTYGNDFQTKMQRVCTERGLNITVSAI